MYIEDKLTILCNIGNVFDDQINRKTVDIQGDKLKNLLDFILNNVEFLDENTTVKFDERMLYIRRLNWLFNKILLVTIYDAQDFYTEYIARLIDKMMQRSLKSFMYWYRKFLDLQVDMLNKSLSHDLTTGPLEINIPSSEIHGNLKFSRIVIETEPQLNNLITFCFKILTRATDLYPISIKFLNIDVKDIVRNVLTMRSLECKAAFLLFCGNYYNSKQTVEYIEVCTAIFQHIAMIYEHFDELVEAKLVNYDYFIHFFLKVFFKFQEMFNSSFKSLYETVDAITTNLLVASIVKIIFFEFKWTDKYVLPSITHWLTETLNNVLFHTIHFNETTIRNMDIVKSLVLFKSDILHVLKYQIILEIENAGVYDKKVSQMSPTWVEIQKNLISKTLILLNNSQLSNDAFLEELHWIKDAIQITFDVDFFVTRRHQISHCVNYVCKFSHSKKLENPNNLYNFKDWDYDHIYLDFFDDLASITTKLTLAIPKRNFFDKDMIIILIKMYSYILQIPSTALIHDDKKLALLAVIISPFFVAFNKHDQMIKAAEYVKLQSLINPKIKQFIMTNSNDSETMNELKFYAINGITKLKLSKLGKSFEWINMNLMHVIFKKEEKYIQRQYADNFINLLITNHEATSTLLNHYQTIRIIGTKLELDDLKNILCLYDENPIILGTISGDFAVVCSYCDKTRHDRQKEIQRCSLLINRKACIVSNDFFKKDTKISIPPVLFKGQDMEFYPKFIKIIQSCIKHSKNFLPFCQSDIFFETIFKKDENVLAQTEYHLFSIVKSIESSSLSEDGKNGFFDKLFDNLYQLTLTFARQTNVMKIQFHIVNMIAVFGRNVKRKLANNSGSDFLTHVERVNLKCMKMLLYFAILKESEVKGVAVNSMIRMLEFNDFSLHKFVDWYKTNILEHITRLCLINSLNENQSMFASSLMLTLKHFHYTDIIHFLKSNLDIVISTIFVYCVQTNKMHNIYMILDQCGCNLHEVFNSTSSLSLYEKIYKLDKDKKARCLNFIYSELDTTFKEIFYEHRKNILQDVLIKYNQNPRFALEVIEMLSDENDNLKDDDIIANYIAKQLLGILNNFELILNSSDCEKSMKKAVLLSLGDLIRFLGGRRISNLCFKIMSLLRSTLTTKNMNLKELTISVWKILIFNCDISTLGPFLSQILVALENYIDDFKAEVDEICSYLIFDNSSLLSTHISDLFFIEKTKFELEIKNAVLMQIESQRVSDGNDFEINLRLMIKHLRNEHADSNVKIYCLQYLDKFMRQNRKRLNNLIFDSGEMDESMRHLLDVLTTCSKSGHNKQLQLQTAKCFGQLGAVKPSLMKQNALSRKFEEKGLSVHSDEFALKLLLTYSTYYKNINDVRQMQSIALGIQSVLQERKVDVNHVIWAALPEFTQELFKPLITSAYIAKEFRISKAESIFWNQAQAPTTWAFYLSFLLVENIENEVTRRYLFNLLPSMSDHQEIASIIFPRIFLHCFQFNSSKESDDIIFREFDLVFKMVMDHTIYLDASKEELNYKFLASFDYAPIERQSNDEALNRILTASVKTSKMIFDTCDFLTRCVQITENRELIERITSLLNKFTKKQLAEVNFKCGEYERAMILLESYIKTLEKADQEQELPFLINIYAKLRDCDLIEGVKALRVSEWSFFDKIFISELTGNFEGTFSYIEMLMKDSIFTKDQIQSIINCYIQSNQCATGLLVADQLLEKLYESNKEVPYCDEVKAEALWRLSKFDELDELLSSNAISNWNDWNVICAKLLTKFRLADANSFWMDLEQARLSVMNNFKISESEDAIYKDNYNEIFHLHLLTDFEKFQVTFEEIVGSSKTLTSSMKLIKNLIKELDSRKQLLQTTANVIESSLSIRRCLLVQLKSKLSSHFTKDEYEQLKRFIDEEIGKTWIECVKITSNQLVFAQQSYAFIMEAEAYNPPELFIEKAKYYWMKDDKGSALRLLELNCAELEKYCLSSKKSASENKEKQVLLSRGRLAIAKYNAAVKNVDFDTNKKMFKNALLCDPTDGECAQNEEIYVLLAEYMDRHYTSIKSTGPTDSTHYERLLEVIEAYGSSMKYGVSYVLQSMPRFLEIWFDAMTSLDKKSRNKSRQEEEIEQKINNYVKGIAKVLKPYYFYTAFSQIISRLGHPSHGVYMNLKVIISKLIEEYPLESMWFIMPDVTSKSEFRKKRTIEILNGFSKERTRFQNFNAVMDKIWCLAQRSQVDEMFMNAFCSSIGKLFKNVNILMPLQKHLQMVQPTDGSKMHSIINSQVLICRIDKRVEVMRSLQKPKKITFHGSDGREYPMLLKFKDDLRIDFRFMEFLKVVNDYFKKDDDASQRALCARTYSVIPWNEDKGIIEWVPNLNTFKSVVYEQYAKSKIKVPTSNSELKKLMDTWTVVKDKKKFFNDMKLKFPPILGRWYLEHFSNAQSYFNARQNYVRSVAVMSMVGYIMGLGDRHMENILFDVYTGEVVHVDFACVFHKGESLGYPETVPFRLTHNMIEAMGPLGIEGPFRKCCEVVLQLMQKEKNTLISYLRPFIYDPMIRKNADQAEVIDSKAMSNLEDVEKKLEGIVKKYKGTSAIALSSEGQVKFIIDEAVSDENLSVMYFYWNPYI